MKNHDKMLLIGGVLCAALMCLTVAAQTASVEVSVPSGEYFYPGTTVTVQADAMVTVGNTPTTFTATFDSVSCVLDGANVFSAPPYAVNVSSPSTSTFYNNTFTVTAPAVGTYLITCTTSGQVSGGVNGPFSGSGSATLTVVACTGDSDYAELPPSANGLWVDTTWQLYANMTPANPSFPNPQSIGYATGTGITGNLNDSIYAFDCDWAGNSDLSEQYPTIADAGQSIGPSGEIFFYFQVTNYNYNNSVPCDTCDANPNGYYPVQSNFSRPPTIGPFTASCGATQ